MAAEQDFVNLRTIAAGCRVPYSTLARWAAQKQWPYVRSRSGRLYRRDVVEAAVVAREVAA